MRWQKLFLRLVKPLVKFIANFRIRFTHYEIDGEEYYQIISNLAPGDVFLTKARGEFTNLFNPSKGYSHGAIYVGKFDGRDYVIEATKKGVQMCDLVSFLTSKDGVMQLRAIVDIDDTVLRNESMKLSGKKYDYEFESNDDEYYCFELVYHLLKASIDQEIYLPKTGILGHNFYSAESFTNNPLFDLVAKVGK